jgi:hypothetical protein
MFHWLKRLFPGGHSMPRACASCQKPLRPFGAPGGMWSGTLGEMLSMPKIEADNGFVCEACGKAVCPVCSGKKAGTLGVREFVCTHCGHRPLKTIYRQT